MENKLIYENELGYLTSLELRSILSRAFDNSKLQFEEALKKQSLALASIYKSELEAIMKFQMTALEVEIGRQQKLSETKTQDSPKDENNDPF